MKKGKKPDNRYKKRRPGTLTDEYLRRQGTKRWLETHIWHAKRMKMVEIWGYKLVLFESVFDLKSMDLCAFSSIVKEKTCIKFSFIFK